MKNFKLVLLLTICFFPAWLWAKQVSLETAQQVAQTQVSSRNPLRSSQKLNLAFTKTTAVQTSSGVSKVSVNAPANVLYYVFNAGEAGFVIVSGDDIAKPVLGYSDTGTYDANNLPPNFVYFLDDCLAKEIEQAIAQGVTQSKETKQQWDTYLSGNVSTMRAATAVSPLLGPDDYNGFYAPPTGSGIAWDQYEPFNHFCPTDNNGNPTVTGCVATAMAQIMKYHGYPAKGNGIILDYPTTTLGIPVKGKDLSTDAYDWENLLLPQYQYNTYTGSQADDAVATLMYDCGISVTMDYNTAAAGGSSASIFNAGKALLTNFNYSSSITYKLREYYSPDDWDAMLKAQIDGSFPVLYGGQDPSTGFGHAFVCDGYDDSNPSKFHFNWGWSGADNSTYFVTTALDPGAGGAGAGDGQYNAKQEMVIDIEPNSGGEQNYEIKITSQTNISASTTTLDRGQAFSVDAPIRNWGLTNFTGAINVAIVDASDNILSIIGRSSESITDLPPGYGWNSGQNSISCIIPVDATTGNCLIRIVYQPAGASQWSIVTGSIGYTDILNLTIKGVTLDNTTLNMTVGDNVQLNPSYYGISSTNVTWSSNDPNIATVDASGSVTAVSKGTTTITEKVVDGTLTYTATCTVNVSDRSIKWLGNTSTEWNISANWDAGRIPTPQDTVTIPGTVPNFPDLQASDNASVAEIHFQPGAQIGHQSLLNYGKAFVQYDFSDQVLQRDRWLMLSIPLGQVYPGDFSFGGYPVTWMQSFSSTTNGTTTSGSWTTVTHTNNEAFSFGDAFVLWVNDDNEAGFPINPDKGLKLLNGIREFPFYQYYAEDVPASELQFYENVDQSHTYSSISKESTFYDFVLSGADYIRDNSNPTVVPRDDSKAYQLAKTGTNFTSIQADFTGGIFTLIGNPYMATLNFGAFQQENTGIKTSYYIWTGTGYTIFTPDGNVGPTSATVITSTEQFIPPLQGFIVEKQETEGNNIALSFNEDMTTVAQKVALRYSASVENKLNIIASTPVAGFNAFIAKRDGGQDEYGDLDARNIINSITDVPDIYTLKPYKDGLIAVGANFINSDDLLIPVGLATSYAGNITLSFSGMNNYDANLSFIDTEANKEIDLTGLTSYDYAVNNYTPKQVNGAAVPCEDRFFIRISKTITGLNGTEVEKANVFEENGHIQVVSGASNLIKEVEVYNQQGALIYKNSSINAISYSVTRNLPVGAYIVKVISEKNTDNVKVIIK